MSPAAPTPPLVPQPANQPTPEQLQAAKEAEARLAALLELGDVNQANAVTLLYGDSGCGKSSLCATAAEYCWRRYHRITEYVCSDLGGFGNKMLRLIRLGIVRAYNPQNHIEPFETLEDLSLGYWPEQVMDPFTGFALPDVRLIPAQRIEWRVYCPQGHLAATLTNKASLNGYSRACDACKTIVNPSNWNRVEEVTLRSAHHQNVGLRLFDSLTSMEDWAMSDLATRAARNMDTIGGDKDGNALTKTGGRVTSGRYNFGANAVSHYGFAQNRVPQWIRNARGIPGMVMPPIFTALELRSSDDTGRGSMPIYGPKIAGSAKTSDVPAWVGNCLHIAREENEKGQMEHRIWTMNHIDKGGNAPHLAKTRAEPGTLPSFIADKADEPVFTRFSMAYFFDQLDAALATGAQQDVIDFPDAPVFQPLPEAEDVMLSARNVSVSALPTQVRTGAPTAAARPPQPATIARPGSPTATVAPRPAATAPAVPATASPKPATPPAAVAATPVAKPASAPPQPVRATTAPAPVAAQQGQPAQAHPPVAPKPAAAAPQPVQAVVQPTTPPAATAAAPVTATQAPAPPKPPAPAQNMAPAPPGTIIRPPTPAAVRPAVPGSRPAVPPPPPGTPVKK